MNVSIYYNIEGGGQNGVKIPPDVKMKLMILGFVAKPLILSLQGSSGSLPQLHPHLSQLINILTKLDTLTTKANQVVIKNIQNKLQGKHAREFQTTISSLTNLISKALTLCTTLSKKLTVSQPNFHAQTLKVSIQSFQQNIKTVRPLKLTAMRSPLKQDLKGLVVGTLAKICLKQLCISDVTASIDVIAKKVGNHGDCKNKPSLQVVAISSKNIKLSKVMSIQANHPMDIQLSPKLLQFSGIVSMFGISKGARVNVTDRRLTTKVKAKIFNKFECDVYVAADSDVDEWGSLIFKANGKMNSQSSLTRMLEERLNNNALNLIKKSEKRVENAKSAFRNATLKTQKAKEMLNSTQEKFENLKKNETSLQKLFRGKKAFYAMVIDWFDNALETHNITMSSSKSCTLTKCNRICNKTCVEDICWDKADVEYQTADCQYNDSYIKKLMPKTVTNMVKYTTTPTIRKDLGKCKWGVTAFFESFLTFGLYGGKRKKRSIEDHQNEPQNKTKLDVNEYLRSRDPSLSGNFDINTLLHKRIPQLPKNFNFNSVLESYILKQHNFDINKLLKEQFPALPENFDIDQEILQAVPNLAKTFSFDEFLKKIVIEAVRLKTPIDLRNKLESLSPRLARDFDKVLRRSLPQLNTLNITDLLQKCLDDIVLFSFNQKKLDSFDVNNILKTKFRGFPLDFDLNRLLRDQLPQLNRTFDINILIKNAILGVGPQAKQLDDLIANTCGAPGFSLQVALSRQFPGFRFKLDDVITSEIKNMISVNVNQTKLKSLSFNKIIKSILPKFRNDFDVDNILTNAFPSLKKRFELREILVGAIPLIKIIENVDVNQLIKGVYPSTAHIDLQLDSALKRRNPALRGQINIEKYLRKRLRNIVLPSFDKILQESYHGISKMSFNFEKILEDTIGIDRLQDLRILVQNGVFPDLQDTNPLPFNKGRGRRRHKRFIKTLVRIGNPFANIFTSVIDAKKNSGCTHIYHTTSGKTETHQYKEIKALLTTKNIAIKKWICKNSRMVKMKSNGYRPRTCCRKDIDCVEFLDPVCVKKNRNCFNQRRIEFLMMQSAFNATLFEEYHKLISTESEVVDVAMKLEEVRLRKEVALQNVQIVKARVGQLTAMENTSRLIYHKVRSIPQVDLGFKVKQIVKASFSKRPFKVVGLSFNTVSSTLAKRRLPFKATIKRKHGKDLLLDFVMDFDSVNSSLGYAVQEAIRLYTTSSRKRRSLAISRDRYDTDIDSCLLARNASLYMSDILASLRLVMESKDDKDTRLNKEIRTVNDAVSSLSPTSLDDSKDSAIKSYRHLLAAYRNERREQTEMTPWNETLVSWKNYIENVTEIRQLANCSGSVDCIEELKESLSEYYIELGNKSDALAMVRMLDELTSGITDLLSHEIPYEQVKERLPRLFALLVKTKDKNLLCSDKPKVLTRNSNTIKLLVGDSATLGCNASSLSEIEYSWTRDDVLIQTDKNGTLHLHNMQIKDEGLYRCMARNHKGSAFSGITKIIVQQKPRIIEHPSTAQVPLDEESTVSFSCVASGKPLPTITWLYRPPSTNISVVLPDESGNILQVTTGSTEKSGYYYCEAMNVRGLAISREARLNIMPVTIAAPKIALLFNVTRNCKQPTCQGKQDLPTGITDELRKNVKSMITRSIKVSTKSISGLRYLPYSKTLARIVMYISTPLGNTRGDLSKENMMEKFSEGRLHLVGKLKRLLSAINNTVLLNDIPLAPLIGLSSTLGFVHVEPECPAGQWLNDKGYFCGEYCLYMLL